eukprot:gene9704-10690_t
MADLPLHRIEPVPPFKSVGLDVFGPWEVIARRTREGSADSKRWAMMFTCLYTRAVHIEVIESMTTSNMINALRRFFAFRDPAKVLRSDHGTNFTGAANELELCLKQMTSKTFSKPRAVAGYSIHQRPLTWGSLGKNDWNNEKES